MDSAPLKFVNHKIEENATKVTYRPAENTGTVIYNLSLIESGDYEFAIDIFREAFRAGLVVSDRVSFLKEGDEIESYKIPEGKTGICTICSMTLDSLLLRKGIPINPIGGGMVEIENMIPRRFTAMLKYEYTTIDPISVMISQGNTKVTEVIKTGNGSITGNIREFHMEAESTVFGVVEELNSSGFTGVLDVGAPNTSLLGVPVTPDYQGFAMIGGTNPVAAIIESGRSAEVRSMKGLIDISKINYLSDY
ncbi:DUF128 domain-containing protein [Methanoplanus limicola]|uniref:NrpR regulatory domain-containing protein n=1 Tax=Methanoplanus limicola DSM 2279 TaxID=937775 RepID=H1YZ00_9EURY|nr:DUF128 domain-containing protein [Methanoplanus limicola]EHQ34229.1 protein of unknown function DUF128 [Methanoplanus limicola DSM 2279]